VPRLAHTKSSGGCLATSKTQSAAAGLYLSVFVYSPLARDNLQHGSLCRPRAGVNHSKYLLSMALEQNSIVAQGPSTVEENGKP
jgi:hypothetical protein